MLLQQAQETGLVMDDYGSFVLEAKQPGLRADVAIGPMLQGDPDRQAGAAVLHNSFDVD